jgi:hypothetical protein
MPRSSNDPCVLSRQTVYAGERLWGWGQSRSHRLSQRQGRCTRSVHTVGLVTQHNHTTTAQPEDRVRVAGVRIIIVRSVCSAPALAEKKQSAVDSINRAPMIFCIRIYP